MKIFCANDWENRKSEVTGFREHQKGICDALRRAGALVDRVEDADFALWVGPADMFRPIPGIRNILYTATESDTYPEDQITPDIQKADILLVPCEHNRIVFQKIHPRVAVVPLGVDSKAYPYHQRIEPTKDEPFRFLFVGNLHPLKGGPLLIRAFERWLASGSMPRNAELFLKTSILGKRNGRDFRGLSYSVAKGREFVPTDEPGDARPRICVDNRYLPTDELRDVYESAHVYAFPTMGEGWGLTLSEAAATGLPCIFTDWSAPRDYMDESTGYPLRAGDWRLAPCPWNFTAGNLAHVRPDRLIHKMRSVYANYPAALERGRRASDRMHSSYTWDQAAAKLLTVIQRYCGVPEIGQRVPRVPENAH